MNQPNIEQMFQMMQQMMANQQAAPTNGAANMVAPATTTAAYGGPVAGSTPAMNPGEMLSALQAQATGIGAAALPTDRLKPPLPGRVERDFTIPPEKENIVAGVEAISYVKLTGGEPRAKRSGGNFLVAKGTLLATTGDSPVGSQVGFPIWPGDYYLRDLKQLLVAAYQLSGDKLSDEAFLKACIAFSFGPTPDQQRLVDRVVGCKTFVGTSKQGKKGLRWITFPATMIQKADGTLDFQPLRG